MAEKRMMAKVKAMKSNLTQIQYVIIHSATVHASQLATYTVSDLFSFG